MRCDQSSELIDASSPAGAVDPNGGSARGVGLAATAGEGSSWEGSCAGDGAARCAIPSLVGSDWRMAR